MRPEDFLEKTDVSHETFATMRLYNELLQKWQKAINLVSSKTLQDSWARHYFDSAQLNSFIPDHVKRIVDLGSGAGFPGMVLAIMRPDLEIHLVESDQRKCQFLKTVSRETERIVFVHDKRVEQILPNLAPDLITARAFASLKEILEMTEKSWISNPNLQFLLLKGQSVAAEIEDAKGFYHFEELIFPSQAGEGGHVVSIKNVTLLA